MSTYGPPRPSGGTYYAASHHAQGPARSGPDAAPARSGPNGAAARAGLHGRDSTVPERGSSASERGSSARDTDSSAPERGSGAPARAYTAPRRTYTVPGQRRKRAAPVPVRPRRRVPGVVGVLAVVTVLCIGGGAAAYFFSAGERSPKERPAAVQSPSAVVTESAAPIAPIAPTPSASSSTKKPTGGEEEVSGDLSGFKKGDCLTVDEAKDNRVEKAGCADPGAQKVLLRKGGTLDDSACVAVKAIFSLSQDASGSTKDFVLCVGPAG